MTCRKTIPIDDIAAEVVEQYRDEFIAAQGGTGNRTDLTEPTIRGEVLLDDAAKASFCKSLANCMGLSEDEVNAAINAAIFELLGGADSENDTLKEIADKVTALAQVDNGLVSVNDAQDFSEEQKNQALENIGLELVVVNDLGGTPIFRAIAIG